MWDTRWPYWPGYLLLSGKSLNGLSFNDITQSCSPWDISFATVIFSAESLGLTCRGNGSGSGSGIGSGGGWCGGVCSWKQLDNTEGRKLPVNTLGEEGGTFNSRTSLTSETTTLIKKNVQNHRWHVTTHDTACGIQSKIRLKKRERQEGWEQIEKGAGGGTR